MCVSNGFRVPELVLVFGALLRNGFRLVSQSKLEPCEHRRGEPEHAPINLPA